MDFVIEWLSCLLAFVLGSLLAWVITILTVKHSSEKDALAHMSGPDEIGAR